LENIGRAEYFIASRSFEGIGMAFLDAMAQGCCVIAPANPTYSDYIVSGINGYLFEEQSSYLPTPRPFEEIHKGVERSVANGRRKWVASQERLLAWLAGTDLSRNTEKRAVIEPPLRSETGNPLVSVVTVVRNGAETLPRTIESVLGQEGIDFEYIVWDGGSSDNTAEIALSYGDQVQLHSESDDGVYDAMNKSTSLARGEFILFMNAGDRFLARNSLRSLFDRAPSDADFVVGHHVYEAVDGRRYLRRTSDPKETFEALKQGEMSGAWHGGIPGHQATATRTALLRELRYDRRFKIAADHELLFRAAARGAKFHTSDTYVSIYEGGGFSSRMEFECHREWIEIGLMHSDSSDRVWRFYTPQLVHLMRVKVAQNRDVKSLITLAVKERRALYQIGRHLSFRRLAKALARRVVSRSRAIVSRLPVPSGPPRPGP
jgi:glycosyltransferase involved in cell wall biosynthesis